MSKFLVILKWMIIYWIFASLIVYCFQRVLIYSPDKTVPVLSEYDQTRIKTVVWDNQDKITLFGYYIPAQKHHQTIVFFHGNAGNIGTRKELMYKLARLGYGIFVPEYRGYAGNKGHPTEKGLYQDARSAMNYIMGLGIDNDDIIILGESLGSGIALQMATEYQVSALILQSPFKSLGAMARLNYPWVLFPVWDKYDNLKKIQDIQIPLLIMHGTKDDLVPYHHGLELFYNAKQSKNRQFKSFPEKGHSIPWEEEYIDTIDHFIKHQKLSSAEAMFFS